MAVRVAATCGAGGHGCPAGFIKALGLNSHRNGVLFATPSVAFWSGQGCGAALIAPFGHASVTSRSMFLREKWVGAGPDCLGTVFAFVRFAEPVFDMHGELLIRVHDLARHRTSSSRAIPAPDLARWINTLTPMAGVSNSRR